MRSLEGLDFMLWGHIPLEKPLTYSSYESWLENGLHGDMAYLARHAPIKENPNHHWSWARSVLVVATKYFPHPRPIQHPFSGLNIARYAQGEDYHTWFLEKLNEAVCLLKKDFPEETFFTATDSVPFMERDAAHRAGLGWFGKNTCLINQRQGSFFFIGEIISSLPAPSQAPIAPPDLCGNCRACIDACPTQALIRPGVLDSRKCISYWNIEAKGDPPLEIREKTGDLFFGCDICQSVCPWNRKTIQKSEIKAKAERVESLRFTLTASDQELKEAYRALALARAKPRGLRRNAIIVAANTKTTEVIPELKRLVNNKDLGPLVEWALEKLSLT